MKIPKTLEEVYDKVVKNIPEGHPWRNWLERSAKHDGIDFDDHYDNSFREVELHHQNNES